MADVMDHGLHSAMLMAMLKSGLQIKIEHDASVNGVLRAAHRIADEQVGIFIYLTCCYLVFEPAAGYLEYANAGNPPMLLYRAASGEIDELTSQFSPLGLMPFGAETEYAGRRVDWRPGDVLLSYSDGVTDAQNPYQESYGPERLRGCLQSAATLPVLEIRQQILGDLQAFGQGVPGRDDITLVVAKAEF
jgi:sigma-B regulation protein RsbU (phosphoserine phosphatase)